MATYKLELIFTGLCAFTFHGDKREPSEVNVLMVSTSGHHKHFPTMSFFPKNLDKDSQVPYTLIPGPDGIQIGQIDLTNQKDLKIESQTDGLSATWEGAHSLDLVPSLYDGHYEPRPADPQKPYLGLDISQATTKLRLTTGSLKADRVAKKADGTDAIWKFKKENDDTPPNETQSIAEVIMLTITKDLSDVVWIEGHAGGKLGLRGEEGTTIRASFTNLPREEVEPSAGPKKKRLTHFKHFYDLFVPSLPPGGLALPETEDILKEWWVLTSTGAICPNATYYER